MSDAAHYSRRLRVRGGGIEDAICTTWYPASGREPSPRQWIMKIFRRVALASAFVAALGGWGLLAQASDDSKTHPADPHASPAGKTTANNPKTDPPRSAGDGASGTGGKMYDMQTHNVGKPTNNSPKSDGSAPAQGTDRSDGATTAPPHRDMQTHGTGKPTAAQ
jgi:hypothetical protein